MNSNRLNLVRQVKHFLYVQQNNCSTSCEAPSHWDLSMLVTQQNLAQVKYAVIVLNRPMIQNPTFFSGFWNNAAIRVTVDGGTLQWDKYLADLPGNMQKTLKPPDLITGDFDSITEDILQKYTKKGCKVVHTPDQNYTDFTKALMELNSYCQKEKTEMDHVIALGQTSGRIDQILGNIQTLFITKEKHLFATPRTKVYIMSDNALSWLLYPGDHVIVIPEGIRKHKRVWCSLVPIGETCQNVTTTGLKWNLDSKSLKFGDLVSTSNTYNGSERVTIRCSNTILWSMKVPNLVGQ